MNPGLIIYIEDSEAQRKALKLPLELRGFKVEVAGDVATARGLFEEYREEVDVVVLDMRLEEPEWPQLTGADVAMEYFNPYTPYPPEFLIHSAYSEVDYYKLALKLGVATYLEKTEYRQADIIRHVRALSIRRALSVKNPRISQRIQRSVESTRDQSEAIENFCRYELEPELASRLGTPFIFLLSNRDRTYCYTGEAGFPESLDVYKVIQTMIFSDIRPQAPFVLDASQAPESLGADEKEVMRRLDGAVFIRWLVKEDIRLSIGLLNDGPDRKPRPEPPFEMASVLDEHLETHVIELFLAVLTSFAASRAKYETERREMMRITGEVCLSVGRDLSLGLQQMARHPHYAREKAADLQATGNMLLSLSRAGATDEQGRRQMPEALMSDFIHSVWSDINNGGAGETLNINGDCKVHATQEDLSIIVSSILQWMARRFIDTPDGIEPRISIRLSYYDKGGEATFEDRSERLSKVLRDRLFYPFAENDGPDDARKSYLSLFLARVLIEERYNGALEDVSDDGDAMENRGHRFRVRFPSASRPN
jgi:DNA-binding response OmpR family regulator